MITNILKASMIDRGSTLPIRKKPGSLKKDKTLQLERTIGCFSSESGYMFENEVTINEK